MSRDLNLLDGEFRSKYETVLERCAARGFELRTFFTVRDPWTQARLYRQDKSWPYIKDRIHMLRAHGANWLADILEGVGPQYGQWATNALPGQSWHQHGLAADSFVLINGRAEWNGDHLGYQVYAEEAKRQGLTAGYYWPGRTKDPAHVQAPKGGVLSVWTWAEIDANMREKFGHMKEAA